MVRIVSTSHLPCDELGIESGGGGFDYGELSEADREGAKEYQRYIERTRRERAKEKEKQTGPLGIGKRLA